MSEAISTAVLPVAAMLYPVMVEVKPSGAVLAEQAGTSAVSAAATAAAILPAGVCASVAAEGADAGFPRDCGLPGGQRPRAGAPVSAATDCRKGKGQPQQPRAQMDTGATAISAAGGKKKYQPKRESNALWFTL